MRARNMFNVLYIAAWLAISASQGWAGCLKPPASDLAISQFRAHPEGLVAPRSDIRTAEAMTRDLAGTDASLAADLIRVAKGTSPRFRAAIAAGLAQAAIACANIDQQAALLIQQAVAGFQDGQFQASFAAVAGDLSTAATEAATAYASSSVGSVVVTNPNQSAGTTVTRGSAGGLTLANTIAAIATTAPKTNTPAPTDAATTAAEPVSATR